MITKKRFKELVDQELIASVRVVPVPLSETWCIDTVVRVPLEAGSTTDTIAKPTSSDSGDRLRKFDSIDDAANFLRSVGIRVFTVDTNDAVSFVNLGGQTVRVVETTMQLWSDDDTEEPTSGPAA